MFMQFPNYYYVQSYLFDEYNLLFEPGNRIGSYRKFLKNTEKETANQTVKLI